MTLYQKINGDWVAAQRPYVKRNGVWVACREVYFKSSVISPHWERVYVFDVTPPSSPEIALSVHEEFGASGNASQVTTRYIRVGVRQPGTDNDPELSRIRVLTDYNGKAATTPLGATYTGSPDRDFPTEPWSDWRYNDWLGSHSNSSVMVTKQWPRNATAGTILQGDTTYHFTAWAQDDAGNWSGATAAQITLPKAGVNMPNVVTKEATFVPNNSGRWKNDGWHSGNLVQQDSPRSQGIWLYGNTINDSLNKSSTIKSAQIFIHREPNDGGSANAKMHLFWMGVGGVGSLPAVGDPLSKNDTTHIGSLALGEGQWFNLPTSFWDDLKVNVRGMGLSWKDPDAAGAVPQDFSVVTSVATNPKCGAVHVVWEEDQ